MQNAQLKVANNAEPQELTIVYRLAVWVKWWSEANASEPNKTVGFYLGIYAMFGVLGTLSLSLAAWFAFLDIITNTALNLHSDLLKTTLS